MPDTSKNLSIQHRFSLLIAAVIAALALGLWLHLDWYGRGAVQLNQRITAEREVLVDKLLEITSAPLKVFITDYSPWDEMIDFIVRPDPEWARINLADYLDIHQSDAVWIFRPDLTEVFGATAKGREALRPFPLPPELLAQVATGMNSPRFFVMSALGLLEVRGAPVGPSDRNVKIAAPYGWLFAARLWNEPVTEKLALLTDSTVALLTLPESDRELAGSDTLTITTRKFMPDWQGRPLRVLHIRHTPATLEQIQDDVRVDQLISAVFGITALLGFYFANRYWVIRPLKALEASLVRRSPEPLAPLQSSSREFIRLGRLVEMSFQHEQTLRQIFAAFNAIEDAVLVLDTRNRRITHVNDGTLTLLGYRREELQGRLLSELEAAPPAPLPASLTPSHLPADTRWYRCRDGHLVEVEIREQTLPATAVTPLQVIVARDVTERKRQEQQRLQAQRLESLGNLAGGVAHDMNNMLTPITLFLEDLQENDRRPSLDLLASVRSSVKRGSGMLRQLLTFGRGIAGERQPLAVPRLFDEIGRIVAGTFPKTIEFEAKTSRQIRTIRGDVTQLHQVLLNLCVNARDAMPRGGRLTLTADNLLVDDAKCAEWQVPVPGLYVLIEVADTGTGIPPELLGRIFEPFFTTKSADLGTGLGLSTSLGIIRSHGGTIRVESEPGRGSRFRLLLPADKTAEAGLPEEKQVSIDGQGRTILMVEDEANIRAVLEKILRRLAFKVLTAADGQAALALFNTHRPEIDLVVTDLHMPGMDGVTLIRTVRREAPDLPILVMSGRLDDETRTALASLRIGLILDKPFGHADVVRALRQTLRPAGPQATG